MGEALDNPALERWRREPTSFIEEVLHDPETAERFELLPAERAFMDHAFTFDDAGRLVYPEWVYGAIKKSGKTGFDAALMLTTALVYGGRYAEGYCLANDLEQSTGRVFTAVRRIVESSPCLATEARVTVNRIEFPTTGATIQAIASDYQGAAGAAPCISCFDELWGYTKERSFRLWDEMCVVPTRKVSVRLTSTYAGFSGESTLLEDLYKRGMAQPEVGGELHVGDGIVFAWHTKPIAPWQTEAWVEQMRRSLRPNQFLRMICNQFVTSEESFVDPAWWDACAIARPMVVDPSMPVWAGVDASTKRDSTGIAVCTWDRAAKGVRLVWHRIFKPTPKDPIDFEGHIEETLIGLKSRFRLREVRFDPYQMAATAQRMRRAGINMVEFPQTTGNLTAASQNLYELIKGQNIIVYPDDDVRLAISRAVAKETDRGWRIVKEKPSHTIDIVIALSMAALGAVKKGGAQILINGCPVDARGRPDWAARKRQQAASRGLRFIRVNEAGEEITADEANAIRRGERRVH